MNKKNDLSYNNINKNIIKICTLKKISYQDFLKKFAKISNKSLDTVTKLFSTKKECSIDNLVFSAQALDFCCLNYLLFGNNYKSIEDFTSNMINDFLKNKSDEEKLFYLNKISDTIHTEKYKAKD